MTQKSSQLVINWHITEACNYRCQYCYAHWSKKNNREIINDAEKTSTLIHTIHQFFSGLSPEKNKNHLPIRINIAGGEPLLYRDKLVESLKGIQQLGMEASVITNASLLNEGAIHEIAPLITVLGISLDSVDSETNNIIGRSNNAKKQVDHREIYQFLMLAKSLNPTLKIKINTVVNAANWRENLNPLIETLSPDKWKVFKMLPILNAVSLSHLLAVELVTNAVPLD